jgi:PAS domain S-box-containing protein
MDAGGCQGQEISMSEGTGERDRLVREKEEGAERRSVEMELRRTNRALRTLRECSQALVRASDESGLLNDVCRIVVEFGGYRLAWVGYKRNDEAKSVQPVAQAGYSDGYLKTLRVAWSDSERGRGPTGIAIRTGQPVAARHILTDPNYAPWREEALKRGYASSLVLPLLAEGEVFGALNIYSAAPDSFDQEEVALLSELANDLAFGIVGQRTRVERDRAELEGRAAQQHFVDEQKQVEQALRESERRYRELVRLANSIILRWSRDGRITFMNEFGLRFFGTTEVEILGRHVVGSIVPESDSTGRDLRPLMAKICANPQGFERNINENMRCSGERVWIDWTNRVVFDEDGQIREIMSIGSDITDRKLAEEQVRKLNGDLRREAEVLEQRVAERTAELVEARDQAESADRVKSAFLATMSHELRTPLNSIIGFSGILLQGLAGPLNDEQARQMGMVCNSAEHLLALINDVLDLSKIEAGQLQLSLEAFDLRTSLDKVVGTVGPLAQRKSLALEVEITTGVTRLTSDRRRVEQVLLNLISNSIKFTEQGRIHVGVCLRNGRIVVEVTDTGMGIRPEDLGSLFRPFTQVDTGINRRHEGTGLGLSICKRLVGLLGGTISAKSEWGKGSTFGFDLPINGEMCESQDSLH